MTKKHPYVEGCYRVRVRSFKLMLFATLIATTQTPKQVLSADKNPIADGIQQIEKMSQLERDRLQRNIATFDTLTPEQKQQYRILHEKLEADRATNGQLNSLLQIYSAWLTNLTPSQRQELSRTTDPAQKYLLVQKYREEELAKQESPPPEIPGINSVDSPWSKSTFRSPFGPSFSPKEMAAIMKVLADDAHAPFDRPEDKPLLRHYSEIARSSIKASPNGPRYWPSVDLQKKLDPLMDRPEIQQAIRQNPDSKRDLYAKAIVFSLGSMALSEINNSRPTRAQLDEVFESLTPEQQEQLNQSPRNQIDLRLEMLYFSKRGENPRRKLEEANRELDRFLSELGLPPRPTPPFGRPGVGGPFAPKDRRPDEAPPGDRFRKGGNRRDDE